MDLDEGQVELMKAGEGFGQCMFELEGTVIYLRSPYLVLRACVPVKELEEPEWMSVPHQDEVPCSICQVSGGGEAQRTLGT